MDKPNKEMESLVTAYLGHTAHAVGVEFLIRASEVLASLLGAQLVFVTRALNFPATRVAIIAASKTGLPDEFDLAETPCALTYEGQNVDIHEGLAFRFPVTEGSGNEAFVGRPFFDDKQRCIGHLGIFFESPTLLGDELCAFIETICGRMGAELLRLELETSLASSHHRLEFHNRILEMATKDAPIDSILDVLVQGVEKEQSGMRCSLMLISRNGRMLELAAAPSLPEEYVFAISSLPLSDVGGCCGKAASSGQPVFIADIANSDFSSPLRELALSAGLRSCWSMPVFSAAGLLQGVFSAYHEYPCTPTEENRMVLDQIVSLLRHILDHYQRATMLRQRTARYQMFLRNSTDGVVIVSSDGRFLEISEGFLRQVGAAHRRELGEMRIWEWFDGMDEAGFSRLVASLVEGPLQFEARLRRLNAADWDAEIHAAAFHVEGELAIWASARDVSERKRMEVELSRRAYCDYLTGLPNREAFFGVLSREFHRSLRHGTSFVVMMLDIDSFKSINDRYGHLAGDRVLSFFANICRTTLRVEDCIGRLGGDELAIVMPETDLTGGCKVAERLCQEIASRQIELGDEGNGQAIWITSSIGIAAMAADKDELALLNRADHALYRAKAKGRNRVVLDC
jgi:diguanylate cyclase (GGDEF)-like protein/PAS domain S-box-containing protein